MTNAPFDPDETHGGEHDEEQLDANSMTWGTVDPDFDEIFRDRLGPLPIMPTPPYAFERVLVAGRRRRARKVWAGAAAAALVVMAGTAGTTVALHNTSSSGPVIGEANTSTSPAVTASASHTPSASLSPSASAKTSSTSVPSAVGATTSASSSSGTPQCHSYDFKLKVTLESSGTAGTGTLEITLTNNSGHSCTTYGYPGLQTETQSGQLQSTTTQRISSSAVPTITLAQGESASTTATFSTSTATSSTTASDCGAPSYYLAVIPPNEQTQIVQTITGGPITVCDSGTLNTNPLVAD